MITDVVIFIIISQKELSNFLAKMQHANNVKIWPFAVLCHSRFFFVSKVEWEEKKGILKTALSKQSRKWNEELKHSHARYP